MHNIEKYVSKIPSKFDRCSCNKLHRNIPTCRNHRTEPLFIKIREIKSRYENDTKSIQAKIQNYSSVEKNIEEKIGELEMTKVEALKVSSDLRKKRNNDINQFF